MTNFCLKCIVSGKISNKCIQNKQKTFKFYKENCSWKYLWLYQSMLETTQINYSINELKSLIFLVLNQTQASAFLTSVKEEVALKILCWKSSEHLSSPNNHHICIKAHPSVGP